MRKIRLMLVAIIVLGVAGGAAAVNSMGFGARSYCTTTIGSSDCCISLTNASFMPGNAVKYVITNDPSQCFRWPICTSIGTPVN